MATLAGDADRRRRMGADSRKLSADFDDMLLAEKLVGVYRGAIGITM
jgi:hypothetical protein